MHLLIPTLYHMKYSADASKGLSPFNLTERPKTMHLLLEFMLDVLLMPYGWVTSCWFVKRNTRVKIEVWKGLFHLCLSEFLFHSLFLFISFSLTYLSLGLCWASLPLGPLHPPPREVHRMGRVLEVDRVFPSLPQGWVSMLRRGWLEKPSGTQSSWNRYDNSFKASHLLCLSREFVHSGSRIFAKERVDKDPLACHDSYIQYCFDLSSHHSVQETNGIPDGQWV